MSCCNWREMRKSDFLCKIFFKIDDRDFITTFQIKMKNISKNFKLLNRTNRCNNHDLYNGRFFHFYHTFFFKFNFQSVTHEKRRKKKKRKKGEEVKNLSRPWVKSSRELLVLRSGVTLSLRHAAQYHVDILLKGSPVRFLSYIFPLGETVPTPRIHILMYISFSSPCAYNLYHPRNVILSDFCSLRTRVYTYEVKKPPRDTTRAW